MIQLEDKIKKINNIKDFEYLRYELYSFFSLLILSKEFYPKNYELSELLNSMDMNFKEYVMKSRTLILARVIREIEKADEKKLTKLKEVVNNLQDVKMDNNAQSHIVKKEKTKKNKTNYMDEMLQKYSRNN